MKIGFEWGSKKTEIESHFLPRAGDLVSCSFPEEISDHVFFLAIKSVHFSCYDGHRRELIPTVLLGDNPDPEMNAINQRLWDLGKADR